MASAFMLRVSQKFINIIVAKTLLYRELPKIRDFTYFLLLIAHFLVFALYHRGLELALKERKALSKKLESKKSKEETLLKTVRKNKCRQLLQETLKGLAKGLNLSSFVLKGLLFSGDNWQYFLLTLATRGVASAIIKSLCMTYIMRVKSLKIKKIQLNLLYHVLPSAILFFSLKAYKYFIEYGNEPVLDSYNLQLI